MGKIKGVVVKTVVVIVNAALVFGGVFYFKNEQQKKQEAEKLASDMQADAAANSEQAQISEKATELQQIIEQNKNQADKIVAENPSTVTVQKPRTITKTIPAVTSTVKVQSGSTSSSSSSSSTSSKTTKNS